MADSSSVRSGIVGQLRLAAILYLLVALIGPIGLVYVPSKLFVFGDASATAAAVRGAEWLLRTGIVCDLLHQTIEAFLVIELYRLFVPVSLRLAQQMAVLGLLPVPIVFLNTLNVLAAIVMLSGADFLAPFTEPQREALAYAFVRFHSLGMSLASVFWGLWLLPLGALTYRSAFAPRLVGVLVGLAGVGYLIEVFARIAVPAWAPFLSPVALPLQALELVFIVWLLIAGFRKRRPVTINTGTREAKGAAPFSATP